MPTTADWRPSRRWYLLSLLCLLSLPESACPGIMDSLSSTFTIEVNGAPIAGVGDNAEDRTQAKTGSEAAVFTLKNGRLQSGDWFLGRAAREDRSFLPKQVLWFKLTEDSGSRVKPVTAHQDGDSYQLKFADASLMVEDGRLFADIQQVNEPNVVVRIQG